MGKKKDKDAKSKKKKDKKESLLEAGPGRVATARTGNGQTDELVTGDKAYVEYVTTEDVMELVNSLDHNLDRLDKSTQALQQKITQNQRSLQRQLMLFKVIALVLVIGIFSIGYTATRSDARAARNVDTMAAGIAEMQGQIDSINKSAVAMSRDMERFDNKLNAVAANVSGVNKIVNKLATDVGKISTNSAAQPYDPRRTGRPWR